MDSGQKDTILISLLVAAGGIGLIAVGTNYFVPDHIEHDVNWLSIGIGIVLLILGIISTIANLRDN